jgi:hypothetical protein
MSTIKISQLGNLTTVQGNVIIPVVGNIAGTLTTVQSNVAQLQTFILGTVVTDLANLTASTTANAAVQSGAIAAVSAAWQANAETQLSQITAANAAIITANTAMKGYVDAQDTAISNSVTGANAAIVTANTSMKGYVDGQDTIISNSVTGANAAIVTANTALKGYVDAQDTIITNSVTGANAAIVTANTALKGYTDAAITTVTNSVTGANAAIVTANTALKGYVDANNATQLTSISNITNGTTTFGNIIPSANVTYNLGSPTAKWKDLYLSGSTIYIGGGNISIIDDTLTTSLPFTATGTIAADDLVVTSSIGCGSLYTGQADITGITTLYQTGFDSNMANLAYGTVALSVTTNGDPRADEGALIFEGNNPDGIGIVPSNDDHYTLGTAAYRWNTVHAANVSTAIVNLPLSASLFTATVDGIDYAILSGATSGGATLITPSANVAVTNYIAINQTYANVAVHNANTAVTHTWQFTQTGNLTLPTNGTVSYTPATSGNWAGTAPTTLQNAIDRLAAVVKALNGGTGA